MGRPSKLSPDQWAEITRRLSAGESASDLSKEFGISNTQISLRVSKVSKIVLETATVIAKGQSMLAQLPLAQQHGALGLAYKLRNISTSLANAAELGSATAHRLQALANNEVNKIDDASPMQSLEVLKGVSALTRLANDSASIALNLLAANKESVQRLSEPEQVNRNEGVLIVPGLMADTAAWAAAARRSAIKPE